MSNKRTEKVQKRCFCEQDLKMCLGNGSNESNLAHCYILKYKIQRIFPIKSYVGRSKGKIIVSCAKQNDIIYVLYNERQLY